MANKTLSQLNSISLPVQDTDKILISRDGINVNQTEIGNLPLPLTDNQVDAGAIGVGAISLDGEIFGTSGQVKYVPTSEHIYVAKTVADIQTGNDWLVSVGGGELHFLPNKIYVWSAGESTKTIDTGYVSIKFNRSKHDITALSDDQIAFRFVDTTVNPTVPFRQREYSDFYIYTTTVTWGSSPGPTAFSLDSPTVGSSNRIQFVRGKIIRCKKSVLFGSRSYFSAFRDCEFSSNRSVISCSPAPEDFAERVSFENCTFGNNNIHIDCNYGQILRFNNCSFDYHFQNLAVLSGGTKVMMTNCHLEWRYGENPTETNIPITLSGSDTAIRIEGNSYIVYMGNGQNPYYLATISTDNQTQKVVIRTAITASLGRTNAPQSLDTFVYCGGTGGMPFIDIQMDGRSTTPNDIPSMTCINEQLGQYAQCRNGVDDMYADLANRTSTTGSAVFSRVTVDENGVTRKNSKWMTKIVGQGKTIITLPPQMNKRRNAWVMFYNSAFVTGSITVKESTTGYASKFDGTTVTYIPDSRGFQYSGTATITNQGNVWNRVSWKDTNGSQYPNGRANLASGTFIEIDTTGMTAGALYLSYFGYDVI